MIQHYTCQHPQLVSECSHHCLSQASLTSVLDYCPHILLVSTAVICELRISHLFSKVQPGSIQWASSPVSLCLSYWCMCDQVYVACVCLPFHWRSLFSGDWCGLCLRTNFSLQQACSMANTTQKNTVKLNVEEKYVSSTTLHELLDQQSICRKITWSPSCNSVWILPTKQLVICLRM